MNQKPEILARVSVAAVALVALVSLPARELAPDLSLLAIAGIILAFFTGVTLVAVISLQFAQFVLRAGGTDVQWFWFDREPAGLESQRAQGEDRRLEP